MTVSIIQVEMWSAWLTGNSHWSWLTLILMFLFAALRLSTTKHTWKNRFQQVSWRGTGGTWLCYSVKHVQTSNHHWDLIRQLLISILIDHSEENFYLYRTKLLIALYTWMFVHTHTVSCVTLICSTRRRQGACFRPQTLRSEEDEEEKEDEEEGGGGSLVLLGEDTLTPVKFTFCLSTPVCGFTVQTHSGLLAQHVS